MGILERLTDGQRIGLGADCLVGRSERSDLRLANPRVSQEHARIYRKGNEWYIRDLGSSNGTLLTQGALSAGDAQPLAAGAVVEFGHRSERWRLADDSPPRARLLSLQAGLDFDLADGIAALPNNDLAQASVHFSAERGWLLESDDDVRHLQSGDLVEVGGEAWRFFHAGHAVQTTMEGSHVVGFDADFGKSLALDIEVSHDFEHVSVQIATGTRRIDIGVRSCYFLLFILAKERFGSDASPAGEGWMSVDEVNRALGRLDGGSHLNVDIFRIRKAMREHAVPGGNDIIERRRGALRLGPSQGTIRVL